jgi:hypothetical protein
MLIAKFIETTLFPASGVGETIAIVFQLFSSIFCNTCVRSESNAQLAGLDLLSAIMRLSSSVAASNLITLVWA